MATSEELDAVAAALVNGRLTTAQMTPREQAEAAWSPTSRFGVDELEDRIRTRRGLAPIHDTNGGG